MNRLLLSAATTLVFVGCNSVTFDELDGFGAFGPDATWMVVETDFGDFESLVLSSDGGLCGRIQSAIDRCEPFAETLTDLEGECNDDALEAFEGIIAIGESMNSPGRKRLAINVQGDDGAEFEEEEYEVGNFPSAQVTYTIADDKNFFTEVRDELDQDTCTADVDFNDFFDQFRADDGEIEILEINGDTMRGEFKFDMVDDDGDNEGEVVGSFSAAKCEVDVDTQERFTCFQLVAQ